MTDVRKLVEKLSKFPKDDLVRELIGSLCRAAELSEALRAVVDQVNDYERVNNLAPSPGRSECWDSVARAKALLGDVGH